jgi:hypothetical protein
MTTCSPSTCTTWIAERDEAFFRLVQGLFTPGFLAGAQVLLAANDPDDDEHVPALPAQHRGVRVAS